MKENIENKSNKIKEKFINGANILKTPSSWNKRMIGIVSVSVAGVGIISASMFGGLVVAMRGGESDIPYSEIAFMPNTNNLDDMSFNYETNKGVKNYNSYFRNQTRIYRPDGMDPSASSYKKTFNNISNKNNAILTNGFKPIDALIGKAGTSGERSGGWLFENENNYAIVLDDAGLNGKIKTVNNPQGENLNNGISITYKGNEAGFFAGIAAALYSTFTEDSTHKVSTFGGMQYGNVYDWMSGYEQGINWFNWAILGYDITGEKTVENDGQQITKIADLDGVNIDTDEKKKTLNLKDELKDKFTFEKIELVTPKDVKKGINYTEKITNQDLNDPSVKWFTGSFDPGDGTDIAAIVNNKIDVMFPVAGPQTSDILSYLNNTVKVIGVDSDISKVYASPSMKKNILGSATKNLSYGATFSMWYAERWTNDFKINDVTGNIQSDNDAYDEILSKGNDMDKAMYESHIKGRNYESDGELKTSSVSSKSWLTKEDNLNRSINNGESVTSYENDNDFFGHDYFIGDYENNGVSFSSGGAKVNDENGREIPLLDSLINEMNDYVEDETTWTKFMKIAYNSQKDNSGNLYIEAHSPTFTYDENGSWTSATNEHINKGKEFSYWTHPTEFYS